MSACLGAKVFVQKAIEAELSLQSFLTRKQNKITKNGSLEGK